MSVRYMVKKVTRWNGEEVFKILDKDMGRLSYSGYTNYERAKTVCSRKNKKEKDNLSEMRAKFDKVSKRYQKEKEQR